MAAIATLGLAIGLNPLVLRHQTRVRTHAGALTRFYLDALLGLSAIRAHTAEAALRREQEPLLVEWSRATLAFSRALFAFETLQWVVGFAFATWLLGIHLGRGGEPATTLLLMYWALNYPRLGAEIAAIVNLHAEEKVVTLRLLEPLMSRDTADVPVGPAGDLKPGGMSIELRGVTVSAAGHPVLDTIDVDIRPGTHVAIVGRSGAGKSTLAGLLLGWQRPATGEVLVDGDIVTDQAWPALRRHIAWIDPSVHLWNASLESNIGYGTVLPDGARLGDVARRAELTSVVERLSGMQGGIGEAGGLLSGGEGQRVRLARAMMNADARLVILDEAFRGLDRPARRRLLDRSRAAWRRATMLCVTHDIGATMSFDRVLVIENGRIVEDGAPASLAADAGSRYSRMLAEETAVLRMWESQTVWRELTIDDGGHLRNGANERQRVSLVRSELHDEHPFADLVSR